MSPPSTTPWLRIHIEHRDADGVTLRLSHSLKRGAVTLRLRWAARDDAVKPVVAWIAEVIGKEFPRLPLGRMNSFPVFVSGFSLWVWVSLHKALIWLPVVLVLADDEFQTKPKALRPPVLIGAMPAYESLLREVEQQSWYLKQEVSRERMMRVAEPGTRLDHCQIVVVDEDDLQWAATSGDGTQVRLMVVLARYPWDVPGWWHWVIRNRQRLASCAVMVLPWRPDSAEDVRLLVEEIVHNQPLHEAMRNLIERRFQGERGPVDLPMLFANPTTNESLRLSSVAEVVEREVAPLRSAAHPGDLKGLRARLARHASPEELAPLFDLLEQTERQAEPFRQMRSRALDFSGEGRGMVPMAELVAASAALTETRKKQAAALSKSIKQGRLADVLEQELERKVDARLLGFTPDGTTYPMTSRDGVAHGQRVRLAVHVGQRGVDSLVIGDTPALDPLLPPLRGQPSHTLKIVVFPKDFRLLSKAMRTVKLPRLGGSAEVTWDLRAPELVEKLPKPGKGGASRGRGAVTQPVAELRFGVYCRNQLLQSFRLRLGLHGEVPPDARNAIEIECDFSQTRNFSSLERLPARAACMGVNEDGAHDTHTLTIVRDGRSAAIQWTEGMMKTFTEAVRKRLLDAASADGGRTSRFTFDSMLKASCTVPGEADKAIRGLADAGRDLFVKLFDRNGAEAGEVLRAIGHAAGETLQFVRHDPDYAFPWPLIYDRKIPEAGRSTLPVCRGGPGCTCGMRPAGYCMNGFWGVRHIIEQLTEAPVPPAGHPIAPAPTTPMLRVLTTVNAPAVQTFLNELKQLPAPCDHQPITPMPDKLLDAVRDAVQRPALLIYLGHMDEVANALQQTSPSLRHPSNAISLMNQDDIVQERLENGEWEVPRSLVLLLGCDTGVTRIDSGSSLAASLLRLGASGVLGTECRTVDGLAARMGTEITRALAAGRSIGHAMHGAVNALAAEGCPLGLAFTFLGATQTCLPPHLLTP